MVAGLRTSAGGGRKAGRGMVDWRMVVTVEAVGGGIVHEVRFFMFMFTQGAGRVCTGG